MTAIAADNFTTGGRGAPNAWSPASDGNNWAIDTGAATLSIVSSQGKATAVTALTLIHLGATTSADFDVTTRLSVNSASYTDAGVIARQTATNTAYRARLSSNGNTIAIVKTVAGTSTVLASATFSVATSTLYWIRFRGIGPNLYAMAWTNGGSAPTSWNVSTYDTAITSTGTVGLCVNTPTSANIALFDNFTANTVFPTTPGVSVLAGSSTSLQQVMVREGSFEIDDSISAMSTCSFTIRDDAGTNHYQKAQQIYVNDHLNGLMFSGVLNSAQEQNIRPNALINSRVDAQDNHYFPAKRTYIGPEYVNQYAGSIATDLLNVLAAEGITAQYASRRETTLAQFALGTLTNTVATTNDLNDGDLELALAGSTYTKTETTTADFSTGTLNDTVASGNALQITPMTALRLRGTAASSVTDCYSYRKIWAGSITINSGDQLFYNIWIASTSPASQSGVQIYCSDGSTFNNITTVADQYNIFASPQSDLSLFAQDQWMDRYIDLTALAGKTIKSVAVALEGNSSGTYNAYFRNIQLYTSGMVLRQNFFAGSRQTDVQLNSVGYKNVSTAVVSVSSRDGYRISSSYNIASVGIVRSSNIAWSATTQTQASSANNTNPQVQISTSIDGGATWQVCTQNNPIPNLTPGMNANTLMLREDLNVGGPNPELTPTLNEVVLSIQPSYATTKTDVRDTDVVTSDFSAGTLTNLTAANNSLALTGQFRAWDDGSISNQTLYGTGTPAHFDSYGTMAVRCDSIGEVRSRFDFAGQWQNFTLEIDVQLVDTSTANYGIVYRTTGWVNANDTYAYNAYINSTTVTLGRGTNGGASTFTSIASVTLALNSNVWYRLKVIANGSNHQVYLDDVLYINATDSTYSAAGYVGVRHFNNSGARHSAFFDNFGIMGTSLTGNRVVTSMTNGTLSPVGTVGNSLIEWNSDEPGNTTLLIEASTDGGSTWNTCTNGSPIPNLTTGVSIGSKSLQLRQTFTTSNANSTPTLYGITALVIGAFSASGTRISPSLSLLSVGRLGDSLVAWNSVLPTGTTLGVDTSINAGSTWTDVTAQNGGSIPGITSQPDATIDTFDSNTATNYSNVNGSGSFYSLRAFAGPVPLNGAWTWDTSNSRVTVVATALSILIYSALSVTDVDMLTDSDYSDTGGLVWRYTNISNYYDLIVQDASSSGGSANTMAIFKVSSGTRTQLATSSISFVRGTYHRVKVTMLSGVITAYLDGTQILTYTDGSPLASGKCGLRTGSGTAHFYQLRIQPLGQDVTAVSVLTRFRLASTDPTVTPQVLDATLAAYGNSIAKGALIPSTQYNFKDLASNFDDLVKQSSTATGNQWWWYIDRYKKFSMLPQTGMASPWIASDNPGDFLKDVKVTNLADLYRNRQIIKNVIATVAIDESRVGDDISRSWTLGYTLSEAPTITINNSTSASVGVKGTDTGKDFYYAVGDATITQDSSGTILTSDQTVHFVGTGQYTTYSQYDDTVEQAALAQLEGGSGIVENVEDGGGISKAAGDQLAQARVKQYGIRGKMLEATTRRYGLAPGMLVSVFLPQYAINDGLFLIREVKTRLTTEYDPAQGTMVQKGWYSLVAISGADIGSWERLYLRQQ